MNRKKLGKKITTELNILFGVWSELIKVSYIENEKSLI